MNITRILAAILALCVVEASVYGQDTETERFLAEYTPHATRLEGAYQNITIRMDYSLQRFTQGKASGGERRHYVYKAHPPLYLFERHEEPAGGDVKTAEIGVRLVSREATMRLKRSPSRDQFILAEYHGGVAQAVESIRLTAPLPFAPYSFLERRIVDFVSDPNLKVTGQRTFTGQDKTLRRVDYQYSKGAINVTAWSVFSPADSWALMEHAVLFGGEKESTYRIRVHYEGHHDGFPLVKALEFSDGNKEGSVVRKWTATEIVLGAPPESEFALAAYGINDAGLQAENHLLLYLLAFATACAALTLLFRYLAIRRRAKS